MVYSTFHIVVKLSANNNVGYLYSVNDHELLNICSKFKILGNIKHCN